MPEHRQEFQRELESIEAKVIELFAVVAEDLGQATRALLSDDGQVAMLLAERDLVIDALHREIEQLVSREIALQAPVASDLRFLLSVLRIMPELERSHHLVVHIARRAERIRERGPLAALPGARRADGRPRIRHVAGRPRTPGTSATASAVVALGQRDGEMDELHASLIAELSTGQMALPVTMDMTLVARFYERLGDRAVNVARRVVYLAGSGCPQ